MNSARMARALSPILIALFFIMVSVSFSNTFPVGTVGNITALGAIELYFFYLVTAFDMSNSKRRVMCSILAISMFACSAPYAISTWFYVNTDIDALTSIHLFINSTYQSFSYAIFALLLITSVLPRGVTNVVSRSFGIDRAISHVNNRFKVRFFCPKGAAQ